VGSFRAYRTVVAIWTYFYHDYAPYVSAIISRWAELRRSTSRRTNIAWWARVGISPAGTLRAEVMLRAHLTIFYWLSDVWRLHININELSPISFCCQIIIERTINTWNRHIIVTWWAVMSEWALKFVFLLLNIANSLLITCIAAFTRQAVSYTTSFFRRIIRSDGARLGLWWTNRTEVACWARFLYFQILLAVVAYFAYAAVSFLPATGFLCEETNRAWFRVLSPFFTPRASWTRECFTCTLKLKRSGCRWVCFWVTYIAGSAFLCNSTCSTEISFCACCAIFYIWITCLQTNAIKSVGTQFSEEEIHVSVAIIELWAWVFDSITATNISNFAWAACPLSS